jgi:hypothetical protein
MRVPRSSLDSGEISFSQYAGLHKKQASAISAMFSRPNARVLMGGSGFGGKSRGLRAAAIYWHLWMRREGQGAHSSLFASSSYESLRDRHFQYFTQEWGEFGEVRTQHKLYGRCFEFYDKAMGAICFRNLDDPNERKGSEYSAGFYDELTEGTQPIWGAFCYMIRRPGTDLHPALAGTNPDGVGHTFCKGLWRPHLYNQATGEVRDVDLKMAPFPDRFGGASRNPADYIYVPFLPQDNPMYDHDTFEASIADLALHVQRARREGSWDTPEGARFTYLRDEVQLFDLRERFPKGIPEHWPRRIHLDYGLRAPFCALWTAFDGDGNAWTYREAYKAGLTADGQALMVANMTPESEVIKDAYLDPAMWSKPPGHTPNIVEKSAAEYYTEEFKKHPHLPNHLNPGYNRSRAIALMTLDTMLQRGNGHPDWHIEAGCVNLWSELTGAVYPRGTSHKDLSEDIDDSCPDHAITAGYYGLHTHLMAAKAKFVERDPVKVAQALGETERRRDEQAFRQMKRRLRL